MTNVTPSHAYLPVSGGNVWQVVMSSDAGRIWKRSPEPQDFKLYCEVKGRPFDSSDPREAVKLMNNKLKSGDPRHVCERSADALREQQKLRLANKALQMFDNLPQVAERGKYFSFCSGDQ